MSLYDCFRDEENATLIIYGGSEWVDVPGGNPELQPVEVFNGPGIFYELGASELVKRQQIQKDSTHGLLLDPEPVTNKIDETMTVTITTDDIDSKEYRIVTVKNPLNIDDVYVLELKGN